MTELQREQLRILEETAKSLRSTLGAIYKTTAAQHEANRDALIETVRMIAAVGSTERPYPWYGHE